MIKKCQNCGKSFNASKKDRKFCSNECRYDSYVVNLVGKRFGRLMVIAPSVDSKKGNRKWLCKCDCGNEVVKASNLLLSGNCKSCGCIVKENITKHGLSKTRLHITWCSMRQRCNDKNYKSYKDYGGRGISVCQEWQEFQPFYDWAINNGYSDDLTIDRIDVNGNYEPNNCRWATRKEQANNTRTIHLLTYNGITKNLKEWAEYLGVSYKAFFHRVERGWDIDRIFNQPYRKRG